MRTRKKKRRSGSGFWVQLTVPVSLVKCLRTVETILWRAPADLAVLPDEGIGGVGGTLKRLVYW
jgi:hypothetical protein